MTNKDSSLPSSTFTPTQQRQASLYLILATMFWGCSFTWTKVIVELINIRLALPSNHTAGAVVLTGVRFAIAAAVWFAIFPAARSGYTRRGVGYGVFLGLLMGSGMLLQTTGLARTSVAVNSFLTSLTVLFVPLISILVHLRLPSPILTIGVLLATCGIWLLTGATPGGFGLGETLGLSCAIVFSVHIMLINHWLPRDHPMRINTIMMLTAGAICLSAVPLMGWGISPSFLLDGEVWWRFMALVLVCTIGAFGLQLYFQPRINPTRAALLYLFEPIFAAVYAFLEISERITLQQLGGAALIILANAFVEVLSAWGKKEETQKVGLP
jgi:drug/metabolite transporter (DMT)-like permease